MPRKFVLLGLSYSKEGGCGITRLTEWGDAVYGRVDGKADSLWTFGIFIKVEYSR
jgi:hypothetical protein